MRSSSATSVSVVPTVTKAVAAAMKELTAGLPADLKIIPTFRQETYIDSSIENIRAAPSEKSTIVALILIPFSVKITATVGSQQVDGRFNFDR